MTFAMILVATVATAVASAETVNSPQTADALDRMANADRAFGRRFGLKATVVSEPSLSPDIKLIAVADDSGSTVVRYRESAFPDRLHPGDLICASGYTTNFFGCNAFLERGSILARGQQTIPGAEATVTEIRTGQFDRRHVRVRGTVSDALQDDIDTRFLILVLFDRQNVIHAVCPASHCRLDALENLIGKEVVLDGFCLSCGRSRRSYLKAVLFFDGETSVIRDTTAGDSDPFKRPDLTMWSAEGGYSPILHGAHRTTGCVLAAWRGNNILVRADNGTLVKATLSRPTLPPLGARIDLVGLPGSDYYSVYLLHADWRPNREPNAQPLPVDSVTSLRARDILVDPSGRRRIDYTRHGESIRLSGNVVDRTPPGAATPGLTVSDGGLSFDIDATACPGAIAGIAPGSVISVTGRCIMETENGHPTLSFPRIRNFLIAVSAPDGITVVSRPSWWTPARLAILIGILGLVIAGAFVWIQLLQKLATRRGRELAAESLARAESELKVRERTRLAVELHDSLSQTLSGVSMEINSARRLIRRNPAGAERCLGLASEWLRACREGLQNCLWDLRNLALDEHDLNEAIRSTLAPHVRNVTLSIRFNVPRTRLSDSTTHAFLQIIRELVVNAIQHGGATKIGIAGSMDDNRMLFSVRDNGCGFDTTRVPGMEEGHFGLQGIRERVKNLKGSFRIRSSDGRGAKATVAIPLPEQSTGGHTA